MTTTTNYSSQLPSTALTAPAPEKPSPYDRFAWLYDWIVGSRLYHSWAWGAPPKIHDAFARRCLENVGPEAQRIVDAGCGSLLFTAKAYRELVPPLADFTLYDGSEAMLARGRRRLGSDIERFQFLRGDLRALPFDEEALDAIFHFGVLHCLDSAELVLGEMARTLKFGGQLWLSSLVLSGRRGDGLLERLHRGGHVARPRTTDEVAKLIKRAGLTVVESQRAGSFLFLIARKASIRSNC